MKAPFTSTPVLYVALWTLVAVQVSHVSAQGQRRGTEQVPSGTSVSSSGVIPVEWYEDSRSAS